MPKRSQPAHRGPATLAIHGHGRRRKAHDAVSTPIVQTSNFSFQSMVEVVAFMTAKSQGNIIREQEYGRYGNPSQQEAERKLAAIEGAERELIRLGFVIAGRPVMRQVREAQPFPGAAGCRGTRGEHVRVDEGAGDAGHGRDDRLQRAHPGPQPGRQHLLELAAAPAADVSSIPATDARVRGPQPDRDRDRLLVVEQQRRHRGAGARAGSRRPCRGGVHRVPSSRSLSTICSNGPWRHPEPLT